MTYLDREHARYTRASLSARLYAPLIACIVFGLWLASEAGTPQRYGLLDFAPDRSYSVQPYGLRSYDGRARCVRWTLEPLNAQTLTVNVNREGDFFTDPSIPKEFTVHPGSYTNSGYQRGHAACARNSRWSKEAMHSTFSMANMMPQTEKVNTVTIKAIEDAIPSLIDDDTIAWNFTGTAYVPDASGRLRIKTIGTDQVWVPTHVVKSVLSQKPDRTFECHTWIVPNIEEPEAFDKYRDCVDVAEGILGLDLWAALPDDVEKEIEKHR